MFLLTLLSELHTRRCSARVRTLLRSPTSDAARPLTFGPSRSRLVSSRSFHLAQLVSDPGAAGKWQVSRDGGTEPRWRADGKEIFYIAPGGALKAVPVSSENSFSTSPPVTLFQIYGRAPISSTDIFTYDVAKNGKRFLVNRYVKPERVAPLTILLRAVAGPSL